MADPSACSRSCSAEFLVDSGLLRMSAIAITPITASGMAMMNASAMPWPYADSTMLRTASGRSPILGTLPEPSSFSASISAGVLGLKPANPLLMYSLTLVARIEPMMVTPMVPAMVRKKLTPDDAAPSCCGGVSFCTIRVRFCITMPSPAPSTNM